MWYRLNKNYVFYKQSQSIGKTQAQQSDQIKAMAGPRLNNMFDDFSIHVYSLVDVQDHHRWCIPYRQVLTKVQATILTTLVLHYWFPCNLIKQSLWWGSIVKNSRVKMVNFTQTPKEESSDSNRLVTFSKRIAVKPLTEVRVLHQQTSEFNHQFESRQSHKPCVESRPATNYEQ